jgi:hypothetical protein
MVLYRQAILIRDQGWFDVSNPASWIFNVAFVSWNHVKMEVHDGLSCMFSAISSDVVSVWLVGIVNNSLCRADHKVEQCKLVVR